MPDSTTLVLEKMCSHVFKEYTPVYFICDIMGNVVQWGGNLSDLNIPLPEKGTHISDGVIFMEGILPLKSESMEFSCIKISPAMSLNALLFKIDKGYGLIIWDATRKEASLKQTQQKYNELSLLIEKQKNHMVHDQEKTCWEKNETLLKDLFLALNFAVLEMNTQGHFVLIGTPPPWMEQIPRSSRIHSGKEYEEDVFSFLGTFIQEAKSRWSKNHTDSFKSGIWIEKDAAGQELSFEATAIVIHGKKLLIISRDTCHPNEKQSMIQKGRNLALRYHDLEKSDKKLKGLHDELELRVKERTKDLEQANLRLANELIERKKIEKEREDVARQLRQAQKMEAIGTLAGGIAHDFNNLLSAIMGFSELSLADTDDDSKIKPNLEKILHASCRAKELVRQILMFSHQTEYEKKPLKLKLIVTEVLNLLRVSLPSSIDIEKDLQSDAYILADQTQMHQVIMNLCTNAWHAMKENGGTLCVALQDIDITPDDLAVNPELIEGRYLVLSIRDAGCGMGPDVIEKIFDPYFTTKDKDKGTGLGLSVVHGIVSKCSGTIKVSSELGKGSIFKIFLPIFDAPDKAKPLQESAPQGNNERILFVDDESFQTDMAEQLLHRLGYRVKTSNDGSQALKMFTDEPEPFDLVITDMVMPNMTGKRLAQKILEIKPDIPIILCSGYSDDINPDMIKQIGIAQYLMKPIGMQELAHAVQKALQKTE